MTRAGLVAALLCLGACASVPPPREVRGDVGLREIDAPVAPSERLDLASNESFQRPLFASSNELPDYPAELLPQALPPQPVCLRVGIDEQGAVTLADPVQDGEACAPTALAAPPFVAAAQAAARSWRFDPAFRCVFPEGQPPEHGLCVGKGVREVPQAVSLVYRFVFEQVEGRGAVRLGD
jgi:hypothetical protein